MFRIEFNSIWSNVLLFEKNDYSIMTRINYQLKGVLFELVMDLSSNDGSIEIDLIN